MTPALIIAASNLTSNVGLAPNVTMVTRLTTANSNSLVAAYANLQPGTTNGNTLSSNSFAVTSLGLPLYISRANTTVANVQTQYNKILTSNGDGTYNIVKFAGLVSSAGSFATTSLNLRTAVEQFRSQTFGDMGIAITDQVSSATNGLSNMFANLSVLSTAMRNLGNAYDPTQLSKLGDPLTFIKYAKKLGFSITYYGTNPTDEELLNVLSQVTGSTLQKFISQTGMVLPAPVTNMSQLLDLTKVFTPAQVAAVPGGTFAALANEFTNLGGNFRKLSDVADFLSTIETPVIPYLNAYTSIVPDNEYAKITAALGTGNGDASNPLITDMLGSVAGYTINSAIGNVNACLTTTLSNTNGLALQTAMTNLANYCAGGNSVTIAAGIAALWTAANTFKADTSLSSTFTQGNSSITSMQAQLSNELTNLALAGVSLDTATTGSVHDVLSMVNSLYTYGVDAQNLGYNELFANCAQSNVGGDAVKASLIEGRNHEAQANKSIRIGSKFSAR